MSVVIKSWRKGLHFIFPKSFTSLTGKATGRDAIINHTILLIISDEIYLGDMPHDIEDSTDSLLSRVT